MAGGGNQKPRLKIDYCNPDQTVEALRDILAVAGGFYDRVVPVRLAFDQTQGGMVAQSITPEVLVLMAHKVCRPYVLRQQMPRSTPVYRAALAVMYLDCRGDWRLPPLNGIASAPLLQGSGTIKSTQGYDPATGLWCENVPDLTRLYPIGRVTPTPNWRYVRSATHLKRSALLMPKPYTIPSLVWTLWI